MQFYFNLSLIFRFHSDFSVCRSGVKALTVAPDTVSFWGHFLLQYEPVLETNSSSLSITKKDLIFTMKRHDLARMEMYSLTIEVSSLPGHWKAK